MKYQSYNSTFHKIRKKKGKLFFIGAKTGERIIQKKLPFDRVAGLFESRYIINKVLAQNIPQADIVTTKKCVYYNPLYSMKQLFPIIR